MSKLRSISYKGKRWTVKARSSKRPRIALKSKPKKTKEDIGIIIRYMGQQYRRFITTFVSLEQKKYLYKKLKIKIGLGLPQISSLMARDVCLTYLYYFEKMSAPEIKEKFGEFFINRLAKPITARGIVDVIQRYKLTRSQEVAMFHRAAQGRIHYEDRNLENRVIDYKKRDKERGYLWANGLVRFITKKGDIKDLATKIGCSDSSISKWKSLRLRVSKTYQNKLCKVLGVKKADIFSEVKGNEPPKIFGGSIVDHKKNL
ncbi:MAG: hypothetical protein BWY16_00656 [Candidatus Omnitrophica bacterium ADurb.Bin205]|nr:MAG: hypothetical protein BWY16_00656 [Candidatus Omnitrophica bacterium ADurb.Bin205]